MRQLNLKLLICLVVPLVLIAAGVHLLWAINVDRSTNLILEKAQAALDKGELREALKHYVQYLGRNPDDTSHICDAAMAAADLIDKPDVKPHDVRLAYRFMARAVRKAPERHDIRRRMIDLLIKAGYFGEAKEQIDILETSGEGDAEMDFNQALCATRLNDHDLAVERLGLLVGYDPAAKAYDAKSARAPQMVKAYVLLAQILRRRDDGKTADATMDQMVAQNPELAEVRLYRARYLRTFNTTGSQNEREKRQELANDDLRVALTLDGTNLEVLLENAVVAISDKEFDSAMAYLDSAEKENPKDRRIYALQGRIHLLKEDYPGAIERYKVGLEQLPKNLDLVWLTYESQLQMKDLDACNATLEQMRKLELPSVRIALAEAQLPLIRDQWREASIKLEDVRPQLVHTRSLDLRVNMLLARCYERLGQPDLELEAYQRALQIDPSLKSAARGKAMALVRLGRAKESLVWLRGMRRAVGDDEYTRDEQLVRSHYHVVETLSRQNPNNRGLAQEAAELRKLMGDRVASGDVEETLVQADKLLRQKDMEGARQVLRRALRKNPDESRLQQAYLKVVVLQKGPAAGLRLLDDAMNAQQGAWEDTSYYRLMRAELVARLKETDVKPRLAALENGLDKFSISEQFQIWRALGLAYYQMVPPDRDAVQRCWERAAELQPGDLQMMELLFDLARERGDELGIVAVVDDARKQFGDNSTEWKFFKAKQLVWRFRQNQSEQGALEDAASLVEQIGRLRPNWYLQALLEADIHNLRGNRDQAIVAYQRAIKLGSANPRAVRRLVELLMASGRNDEARIALNTLSRIPQEMARFKVVLEAVGGDESKALAALAEAVPDDSQNPEDFLWKGQVLAHLGQQEEAARAFHRAVQLGPGLPQAWLSLIEHLVRIGQAEVAERYVRQAENQLSEDNTPLVMAQCYALLGNHGLAEHYFQSALTASPENPALLRAIAAYYVGTNQIAKAEHYLKTLLRTSDSPGKALSSHAVWARRSLARILAAKPEYSSFRTAIAVLEANRVGGAMSDSDEKLKAQLMGQRLEPRFRRQALRLLGQLEVTQSLSFDERITLAQLYNQSDRWRECRDTMLDLVTENPQNTKLLAVFSDMLLERKETDLARTWADRLAQTDPKSPVTIGLLARVYMQRGEQDAAITKIEAMLPAKPTAAHANRMLTAARLYEQINLYQRAEEKFRTLVRLNPGRSLDLAEYLVRRGRLDEAFTICEASKSRENILRVCGIATNAVVSHTDLITEDHIAQIDRWFATGLKAHPKSVELNIDRAATFEATGKADEAESVLQKLLAQDLRPVHKGALVNNLAFMRAMRGKADKETMQLVDEAEALLGPQPSILDTRAMVYLARGECTKAQRELEEATLFGADAGLYYFHLALAHQCAEDRSAARKALKVADAKDFASERLSPAERSLYEKLTRWLTR